MTKITLQAPGKQHLIQAVPVDSILACEATSAPDVYVGCINAGATGHNLEPGDSMLATKGAVSMYLFRKSMDAGPFSATLDLTPVPAASPGPHPGAASALVSEIVPERQPSRRRRAAAKKGKATT